MELRRITCLVISLVLVVALSGLAAAYQEAPMLANLVAKGELPPVDERLPGNPLVIEPFEQIGTYGGIVRGAHRGPSDATGYYRVVREPLVNYDNMLTQVQPNLAERWVVSEDGKEVTFFLREGLKWSDGQPFTTDDIMFWWEVLNTRELFPGGVGSQWMAGGACESHPTRQLTVTFKWAVPNGAFVNALAAGNECFLPKHYLSQFHANYVDVEKLNQMAKAEGLNGWNQLFEERSGLNRNWRALGMPTMDAWIMTTDFDDPILVSERNPTTSRSTRPAISCRMLTSCIGSWFRTSRS